MQCMVASTCTLQALSVPLRLFEFQGKLTVCMRAEPAYTPAPWESGDFTITIPPSPFKVLSRHDSWPADCTVPTPGYSKLRAFQSAA